MLPDAGLARSWIIYLFIICIDLYIYIYQFTWFYFRTWVYCYLYLFYFIWPFLLHFFCLIWLFSFCQLPQQHIEYCLICFKMCHLNQIQLINWRINAGPWIPPSLTVTQEAEHSKESAFNIEFQWDFKSVPLIVYLCRQESKFFLSLSSGFSGPWFVESLM